MRKRIYDIIQIGNRDDAISKAFDWLIVSTIILNILALFMKTFSGLASVFSVLTVIEYVTTSVFLIEYVLRIVTADYQFPKERSGIARLKFLVSFEGIVDLLTILPFFFLSGFIAFRILRVVRIFHLFRINSQYDSFQVIGAVFKEKWKQIVCSLIIIFILMLSASLCIYNFEHEVQPQAFPDAFSGMWWSVSAILTVGYGDIYPITFGGRILAIVVALLGVGVVAIPTGIISAGFVEQYAKKKNANADVHDINSIGEILIEKSSPFCGQTIREIQTALSGKILLVLRKGLSLLPTENVIVEEKDILVIDTNQIMKNSQKNP